MRDAVYLGLLHNVQNIDTVNPVSFSRLLAGCSGRGLCYDRLPGSEETYGVVWRIDFYFGMVQGDFRVFSEAWGRRVCCEVAYLLRKIF